ncbi:MAG: fused MFS/spermidine synthase [Candidatus Omnitrophota bacterium]
MADRKKIKLLSVIALLFFFSGACGLIYEVVWLKILGLVFGNTTFAVSTVLTSFMAGLGLGALYFGRVVDQRAKDGLLIYALLEIGIGLYCFLTPLIWGLSEHVYLFLYQRFLPTFLQFSLIRFCLSFLILLIPTFLMGGTLPVLTRAISDDFRAVGKKLGFLYGVNTLGACSGVVVSSFFALYYLGLNATIFTTAAVNTVIGLIALVVFMKTKKERVKISFKEESLSGVAGKQDENAVLDDRNYRIPEKKMIALLLFCFGLSGFTSMVYEVSWTKILALSLGSSIYSFAVMLATFLAGLAFGSMIIAALAKRINFDYKTFGVIELAVAFFVLIGIGMLDDMPIYFLKVFRITRHSLLAFEIGRFFLCGTVMFMPTLFIGAAFAVVSQIFSRYQRRTGASVGFAYFVNTLGCILGSFTAGFVFVPWLGIQKTFLAAVLINFFIGCAVLAAAEKHILRRSMVAPLTLMIIVVFLLPQTKPWMRSLLNTRISITPDQYVDLSDYQLRDVFSEREFLYYKEGLNGIVSVIRKEDDYLYLTINGNVDASSGDMITQLLLGHLPMLLADSPRDVLVIGMGSGVTLAAVAAYPCRKIHCVELESSVVESARFFKKENRNVLGDQRLRVFTNDARNHLFVEEETYDVIISEPSSPYMAGVANLFTIEQFKLMRKRLNPSGIVCQWFNTYSMSPDDLKMIVKTFSLVFKHVTLWRTNSSDLLLIGANEKIPYDFYAIDRKINSMPLIRQDLGQFSISDAKALLSCFVLAEGDIKEFIDKAAVNSDNFPRLEYSSPRNLYKYNRYSRENQDMLEAHRKIKYPPMADYAKAIVESSSFHNALASAYIAKNFLPQAAVELSRALAVKDVIPEALFNFGLILLRLERIDEAVAKLEQYIKISPRSEEGYYYLAFAYGKKGMVKEAQEAYRRAIILNPYKPKYRKDYAAALIESGQYKEAVIQFKACSRMDGIKFETGFGLAKAYFLSGEKDEALGVLKTLIDRYPYLFVLYHSLSVFYEAMGNVSDAVAVCLSARDRFPYKARNYYRLYNLYTRTGNKSLAAKMIKKAARYDPVYRDEIQKAR